MRADDEDRARARQPRRPRGELAGPQRVVDERRRAVPEVEGGHALGRHAAHPRIRRRCRQASALLARPGCVRWSVRSPAVPGLVAVAGAGSRCRCHCRRRLPLPPGTDPGRDRTHRPDRARCGTAAEAARVAVPRGATPHGSCPCCAIRTASMSDDGRTAPSSRPRPKPAPSSSRRGQPRERDDRRPRHGGPTGATGAAGSDGGGGCGGRR